MRQVQGVVDLDKQTDFQVTSLSDRLANTNNKLGEVTNSINRSATLKRAASQPEEAEMVKSENKEPTDNRDDEAADFGSGEGYEESSEEEANAREGDGREDAEVKQAPGSKRAGSST